MTHAMASNNLLGILRGFLAVIIAVAVVGLMFMLAAFLTMAALVAVGVAAIGAAGYWLYRKVRGKKTGSRSTVLVAKRGPQGWTVDHEDCDPV